MEHENFRARGWVLIGILALYGCSGASEQVADPSETGQSQPAVEADDEPPTVDDGDAGLRTSKEPTNKIGTASVGSLPRAVIRKVVGERIGEITSCYERLALGSGRDLKGVVEVKFIVGVSGAVTMASISSTTLRHEPTEKCIADVIRKTQFPPPDGAGVVVVTYPFELTYE